MRIRVATLNVWALPEPFARDVMPRMRAIAAHLPALEADVVAFQEVWTADARALLLEAGRRGGLRNAWHMGASLGGSGLLLISRLPITRYRFERFALRGHPERLDQGEYFGGKGFVRVHLDTPHGELAVMDTHLHARYPRDVAHEYRSHRAGQVVQIAMAVLETRVPVIAAGDFNFGESHAEHEILTGLTGMRDVAAELDHRQPTVWADNAYRSDHRRGKRIDLIFARDGVERALVAHGVDRVFDAAVALGGHAAAYSDHAGVLAELELTPRETAWAEVPDGRAVALAARLLAEGRAEARRRQRDGRAVALAGLGAAATASLGARLPSLSRRELLRGGLQGAAALAAAPGLAFSVFSELFVPDELRAFDHLAERLTLVDPARETLA